MTNSGWGVDSSMRYSASETTVLWPADRAGTAYYLRRRPQPFGAIGASLDVKTSPQARAVAAASSRRLAARAAAPPPVAVDEEAAQEEQEQLRVLRLSKVADQGTFPVSARRPACPCRPCAE